MVLMSEMLAALVQSISLKHIEAYCFPQTWTPEDWAVFYDLARFHGLTPLIAHHAENNRLTNIPDPQLKIFQKDLHKNRLFHNAASARLRVIENAFNTVGIPATPLKGPRLSDDIYPSKGLRPFEDLDILIDPEHVDDASTRLRSLGYKTAANDKLLARYHFHSQWFHPVSKQCVELHWRAADKRSLPTGHHRSEIAEQPEAYAVYLAVHLAKHGIVSNLIVSHGLDPLLVTHPHCDVRLIWLLDFALMMETKQIEQSKLMSVAKRWQVSNSVTNALYLSRLVTDVMPVDKPLGEETHVRLPLSWKDRLIKRIELEFQQPAHIPEPPWWLRPGKYTGFRPIRILDLFKGN